MEIARADSDRAETAAPTMAERTAAVGRQRKSTGYWRSPPPRREQRGGGGGGGGVGCAAVSHVARAAAV